MQQEEIQYLAYKDSRYGDRSSRASVEYHNAEYQFIPIEEKPNWFYCVHDKGKNVSVYHVSPRWGCDVQEGNGCPDAMYRSRTDKDYRCKHFAALLLFLEAQKKALEEIKKGQVKG
jgi:hypothetical protein